MAKSKKDVQWGKAVRISSAVLTYLGRYRHGKESVDSILRRHFGMPTTKGKDQTLVNLYVVNNFPGEPIARRTLAEARGEAILLATKRKLGTKKAEAVIEMREIPS